MATGNTTVVTPATIPVQNVNAPAVTATPVSLPWWISFTIQTGIGALHLALRNPGYAAKEKEIFLELYTAIKLTYAGDPDFS